MTQRQRQFRLRKIENWRDERESIVDTFDQTSFNSRSRLRTAARENIRSRGEFARDYYRSHLYRVNRVTALFQFFVVYE